jgi:hypothetical protein
MITTGSVPTSIFLALALCFGSSTRGEVVHVGNTAELRQAIRTATAGTRIEVAPGDYTGGLYFENLRGEEKRPIIIAAATRRIHRGS